MNNLQVSPNIVNWLVLPNLVINVSNIESIAFIENAIWIKYVSSNYEPLIVTDPTVTWKAIQELIAGKQKT
jgi:hypothetical protein